MFHFLPTAPENNRPYSIPVSWQQSKYRRTQNNHICSICLNHRSWNQSLDQKDPMRCSPQKRGNLCGFTSQIILQPPYVVHLKQTLNYQQLYPPDMALYHTATPPLKKGGLFLLHDTLLKPSSCFNDPGLVSMPEFVYKQDLCILVFAYVCTSVGMPQVSSCTKGKCLSALNKN